MRKYRPYRLDHARFTDALIALRRAGGIPQKRVALLLGISVSQYSRIETCMSLASAEQFMTLCWLFELDPFTFLVEMEKKQ